MHRNILTAAAITCVATFGVASLVHANAVSPTPLAATVADEAMSDANILALLMAVNDHEIAAANLALTEKKVEGGVEGYAKMMLKDHTANNKDTHDLSEKIGVKPDESEAIKAMKLKESEHLKHLKTLDGEAFATAYVQAMIDGHTKVLSKLDDSLKVARNADLKEHLTKTRETVAHHLEEAKELQTEHAKDKK